MITKGLLTCFFDVVSSLARQGQYDIVLSAALQASEGTLHWGERKALLIDSAAADMSSVLPCDIGPKQPGEELLGSGIAKILQHASKVLFKNGQFLAFSVLCENQDLCLD